MKIRILKLHPDAQVPKYQTEGAACFDLHAVDCSNETDVFNSQLFRTGLAFEVPEGHVMMVYSRSGQGFNHAVRLANCVGVVDSDFRGEVMVRLVNDRKHGTHYTVSPGDRIAQAMIVPVPQVEFVVAEQLGLTERGSNGFGSTDKVKA
jgi:dUTP pyrophosphatase